MDNKIVEANIRLQDMNKILEKENEEMKCLLYSIYNYLKKYGEIERVYYFLQEIKEVLKI